MNTKNKAVLITGATKRIGLALTKQSLSMGFAVIAHFRSSASPLKTWLKRNNQFNKKVFYLQSDLDENATALIDKCSKFPVSLTGLINNASLFTEGNLSHLDHLNKTITINATVPHLLSLRFSQKIGNGWIINITDANTSSNKRFQNYRFSKKILTELTLQQAYLFGPLIRVNAIAPGAILPPANMDRDYFTTIKRRVPLKKTGDINSILKAYTFLVENTAVTGQVLSIDNGLHLLYQ